MAMAYGRSRRRRFRRRRIRPRRRLRPRYRRMLRRNRYKRHSRRKTALGQFMKALLPEVPIKYIKTTSGVGSYAKRAWFSSDVIGNAETLYTYKDYLPGGSMITDDGGTGTSTHLTFQGFNSKRFKAKHSARLS